MLNGKLALHDVGDVEGLCGRIIKRSGLKLSFHEHEDLLAFLVETAWELSLGYDPGDLSYPPNFSTYASTILGRRCYDWKRSGGRTKWQFADRTYERILPDLVSLEHRPDGADGAGTVDVDRVRELDLRRLLGTRGSGPARGVGPLVAASGRRAA